MIKRIITEMLRDKRTLALIFLAPLVILSLFYFMFQSNDNETAVLGVRNVDAALVKNLKNKQLKLQKVKSSKQAKELIKQYDYAGILSQKNEKLTLTLQNSDQNKSARIKQSLQLAQIKLRGKTASAQIKKQMKLIRQLSRQLGSDDNHGFAQKNAITYTTETHYVYGSSNSTFFDTLLPIMIGFVVFFFVFLISGISLLRERTSGTLNRLLATPIKRSELISGYLLGFGIFALCQTVIIVLFSIYVFNIQILGSIWNVLLINILLALTALTIGLFVSSFASSEFQMVQFIPLIVIPQIFFSGIIPVSQMAKPLQIFARFMPLYYGGHSLSEVIEKGAGLSKISLNLGILAIFIIFFLILNQLVLRRYRNV
ncbi:multidrug ABC superfamily ATP binding cassette transporter, permease protein [Liquorilactobacillus oeni DSM 19972]|uniref:Multidrug ABC superfamily ATP binding cassette transporter, permease protein n=2 Tax=Liquorilactobacillus oeni TaxID=303241 RepID=A0A0R1M8I2_9LACO|nr:multidrug ABC superfamily ATP binding cassette transporter, permease protein [Liquorilactobacillus oeni DSM 19972]